MALSTRLPIAAGLAILGSALGVHLGRSAIAEIDPLYFAERPVRFHADLVPNSSSNLAHVQTAQYPQPAPIGLGSGCVRCVPAPVEYVPERHGAGHDEWVVYTPDELPAPVEAVLTEEAPDPELERVERYASYAVTAEPIQAVAAEEHDAYESSAPEDYSGTW